LILVHLVAVSVTLNFFRGQFAFIKKRCGFEDIYVVCSPDSKLNHISSREDVKIKSIEFERRITPLKDISTIYKLYNFFRTVKPTIVQTHNIKPSLLGMIAATLAGVPIRIYHLHTLFFSTASGIKRKFFQLVEAIICKLSHRVYSVSRSIQETIVNTGLCPKNKITVIGPGTINGIDGENRFNPKTIDPDKRIKIRNKYSIPLDSVVIGFIGRIVKDKGIIELSKSWEKLAELFSNLFLILIGPVEGYHDPVPKSILDKLSHHKKVRFIGPVEDPENFFPAMDIVVLPTHREGFPITPLEAAAMELPVVISNVDGCKEAVLDGVTGILVPPKDVSALSQAIESLVLNPEKRKSFGIAGRKRIIKDFKPEIIWEKLSEEYNMLLTNYGKNKL
jgi:glycosyltransferase involved in cell wall biosynthesis